MSIESVWEHIHAANSKVPPPEIEMQDLENQLIRETAEANAQEAARRQEAIEEEAARRHDLEVQETARRQEAVEEEAREAARRQEAVDICRYAIETNPEDYDALYNLALALQKIADNVSPESSSPSKDALLEEACKTYEEVTRLCPTLNNAYYNLAVAISDRAKMHGRTKEAEEFWKQAIKNYEKAVQLNWNRTQALNNWGLALQELSAIVPACEKQTIVKMAISKFRAAIKLQVGFHGAIYNLGTVLYGLAEDISRTGGHVTARDELYSQSAIYIAAAQALEPNYSVYSSAAMKPVRSMLPLPYLKVGYLMAPPVGNPFALHRDWKHSQFVLSHEGLQQISEGEESVIKMCVGDIISVSACADLTLPPGAGLCIDTNRGPVFLVAESWEALDGWLDAIRLVHTIFAQGKSNALAGIITVA